MLVTERGQRLTDRFQLRFAPRGDLLDAARDCELDVFSEAYGNTLEQWIEEYGPYDNWSQFLTVADGEGTVVAVCRLITAGPLGLKTLRDLGRPPWQIDGVRSAAAAGLDASRTWDIATIAVRRSLGRDASRVAATLYHGIVLAGRANAVQAIVTIIDARARRLLSAIGLIGHPLPGTHPGEYLGSSASSPLWADLAQVLDTQRHRNPEGHRLVSRGLGLEGIHVPPLEEFVIPEHRTNAGDEELRRMFENA